MLFLINKLSGFLGATGRALAGALETEARAGDRRDFWHGRGRAHGALTHLGVVALVLGLAVTAAQADAVSELARARHDLAISEQVLARVSVQAERARADPATGPQERARLDEYLARVRELVAQNRERVQSLEEKVQSAPAGLPGGAGGGAVGVSGAATNAEEVAVLDARLSGSLTEFDQLLLEEARKAQTRAPSSGASGAYSGGSGRKAGGKGAQQSDEEGTRSGSPSTSAGGNKDPEQAGAGPGSPGGRIEGTDPGAPGPTAAVPPDVGDGSDDDIVARQIRKAAEAEKDPELREKLWDEYRKYKRGTKG
jgi:hypothetical protein